MRYRCTFLLILLTHSISFCQQVLEKIYDVDAGLPFQEVTSVHMDRKGYLWVEYSNQEYSSRFDGITWLHYRFTDYGLPQGLNFFGETDKGLWYAKENRISGTVDIALKDNNQHWKHFVCSGKLIFNEFKLSGDMAYLDSKGRIYSFADSSFVGTGQSIPDSILGHKSNIISIHRILDGNTLSILLREGQSPPLNKHIVYNYMKNTVIHPGVNDFTLGWPVFLTPTKYYYNNQPGIGYDLKNNNQKFFIHGILKDRGHSSISFLKNTNPVNYSITVINDHNKVDQYIFNYGTNTLEKKYSDLHVGYRFFNIAIDSNNNLWYPTHSGLIRRNPHILTFAESVPEMVTGLHTLAEDSRGRIWFGGYNQTGWSFWDGERLQRPKDRKLLYNRVLPGSLKDGDKIWFFEESQKTTELSYIQNSRLKKITFPETVSTGYYFTKLQSGKIAAGLGSEGLLVFNPTQSSDYKIIKKDHGLLLDNVLTLSEDKNNRIWMGRTSQGIACYDPKRDTAVTWLMSPDNPKSLGVMASKVDSKGDLWMGTTKGLYRLQAPHEFELLGNQIFEYIRPVLLPGDLHERVLSIIETPSYIAAGSAIGIYLIDKRTPPDIEGRQRVFALIYGEDIPGKGSEQNAIITDKNGYLWVGTNEGALRLDINNMIFDTTPLHLTLESAKIGTLQMDVSSDIISGPKGQRSLEIQWNATGNHYFQNNVFATILIINKNKDTVFHKVQTKDKILNLPYLAPDTYTLIIKGYKNNQLAATLQKEISIPKLLSENTLFWVALVFLCSLIPFLYLIQYSRTRRTLAENKFILEQAKRNQDQFKIKSLSNFFNPHFINNTLHWLQGRFKKDKEATTVIDSLATNVNLLYQNIELNAVYHSLKKEMTIVDNYIEIQQVKFGNTLNIDKTTMQNIDPDRILLPAMLLQIHVENAVEKGIRYRSGAGKLVIRVYQDNENILVTIEDDGKGRFTKQDQSTTRKGSTIMMNDLISILNNYNKNKITMTYEDHIFNGKYGTRVKLVLPKEYNYDLEKI